MSEFQAGLGGWHGVSFGRRNGKSGNARAQHEKTVRPLADDYGDSAFAVIAE
jgi:hypothetical protein